MKDVTLFPVDFPELSHLQQLLLSAKVIGSALCQLNDCMSNFKSRIF